MKLSQRIYNYFYPPKPPRVAKRHYAAARVSRRNADWTSYTQGANWTIRCDLQALRARARDMAKNSPHFRKFLQMAKSNVVGHKGIQLQCDAVFGTSGRPYTTL
ncbi:MAG TPA: phage portal protein, partial [Pyrinomonadaceae bacterium]|nr:phage portal protein [Pyrinomonadaceae bacterium]